MKEMNDVIFYFKDDLTIEPYDVLTEVNNFINNEMFSGEYIRAYLTYSSEANTPYTTVKMGIVELKDGCYPNFNYKEEIRENFQNYLK